MEIYKTTGTECCHCVSGDCDRRQMVIDEDERQEIVQRAIEVYGEYRQVDQAIEEMCELIKALLKVRRFAQDSMLNVAEEIVDVQITLDQPKIMYGWDSDIETVKLARLQRRILDAQKG